MFLATQAREWKVKPEELEALRLETSEGWLSNVRADLGKVLYFRDVCIAEADHQMAARWTGHASKYFEMIGHAAEQLKSHSINIQNNFYNSPDYWLIQRAILEALTNHSEARAAVLGALENFGSERAAPGARVNIKRGRRMSTSDIARNFVQMAKFDWSHFARPSQLAPIGDWFCWMILAGRGFGKTRTGAEWVRSMMCGPTPLSPGKYRHIALVAETAADARDVMVGDGKGPGEGSGLLQVHPKDFMPTYESSKRRLRGRTVLSPRSIMEQNLSSFAVQSMMLHGSMSWPNSHSPKTFGINCNLVSALARSLAF